MYINRKEEVEPSRAIKILETTKEVLSLNGWCQNRPIDATGRVCLSQAIVIASCNNVVPYNKSITEEVKNTQRLIMDTIGRPTECVPEFNDSPGTTIDSINMAIDVTIESQKALLATTAHERELVA